MQLLTSSQVSDREKGLLRKVRRANVPCRVCGVMVAFSGSARTHQLSEFGQDVCFGLGCYLLLVLVWVKTPGLPLAGDVAEYQLECALGAYSFGDLILVKFPEEIKKGPHLDRTPMRVWCDGSGVMHEVAHVDHAEAVVFARFCGEHGFIGSVTECQDVAETCGLFCSVLRLNMAGGGFLKGLLMLGVISLACVAFGIPLFEISIGFSLPLRELQ